MPAGAGGLIRRLDVEQQLEVLLKLSCAEPAFLRICLSVLGVSTCVQVVAA
jgi:hypothetical protein